MPEENEAEGMRFDILKAAAAGDGAAARLGRLALPRRQAVDTPNYFAVTSRGTVPHLTPDTIAKYGSFSGAYMAMEDRESVYLLAIPSEHAPLTRRRSGREVPEERHQDTGRG